MIVIAAIDSTTTTARGPMIGSCLPRIDTSIFSPDLLIVFCLLAIDGVRIRVERGHGLADDRADAVDALADGDELLGLDIALLVGHAEILVRDLRNDELGIVDGSVGVDDFLLLFLRLLRGSDGLGSLDVLAVLEELDDLNSLAGADDDVPVGQLVLDLALHDGDLAGDDERAVVDLLVQLELVEELLDGGRGELTSGPRRQNGHAGRPPGPWGGTAM